MEVVKGESKEENGRNDQKEVKNKILQIRMIMRKFRITVRNGPREENWLQYKEDA